MATVNIRLDDDLKKDAYAVLDRLSISPSEAVRLLFQYIAENERLPVKTVTVSEAEDDLIKTVRERLANPLAGIRVNLDEL